MAKTFIFHMVLGAHGFYRVTKLAIINRSFILKVTSNLGIISGHDEKLKKVYIDLFAPEIGGRRGSQDNIYRTSKTMDC